MTAINEEQASTACHEISEHNNIPMSSYDRRRVEMDNEEPSCDEYEELTLHLPESPIPTFPDIPWSASQEYFATIEGLHSELIECYNWLKPSDAERFARYTVCQRVRNVITRMYPDAVVTIFGSVASNLFIPTSDVDISIELPQYFDMQMVATSLKNTKNFTQVNLLDRVNPPIIKLVDISTGIKIDLSFNVFKAHNAVEFIAFMRYYFPALELLTLILKQFLAKNGLNQPFTGGLSSYALVLMIIHYMLRFHRQALYLTSLEDLKPGTLGEFLLGFFNYYGNEFDPKVVGLAFPCLDVLDGEVYLMSKVQLAELMNENLFASVCVIQDPLQSYNNVARGCHQFMQIQAAFSSAYAKLEERLNEKASSNEPLLQSILAFSSSFVQTRKHLDQVLFDDLDSHIGNLHQPPQVCSEAEPRMAQMLPTFIPRFFAPPIHFPPQQQQQPPQPSVSPTFEEDEYEPSASNSESPPSVFSPPFTVDGSRENGYPAPNFPSMPMFFPPPEGPQMFGFNPYFNMPPPIPPSLLPYHFMNGYASPPLKAYEQNGCYFPDQQLVDDFSNNLSLNGEDSDSSGSSDSHISSITSDGEGKKAANCHENIVDSK